MAFDPSLRESDLPEQGSRTLMPTLGSSGSQVHDPVLWSLLQFQCWSGYGKHSPLPQLSEPWFPSM